MLRNFVNFSFIFVDFKFDFFDMDGFNFSFSFVDFILIEGYFCYGKINLRLKKSCIEGYLEQWSREPCPPEFWRNFQQVPLGLFWLLRKMSSSCFYILLGKFVQVLVWSSDCWSVFLKVSIVKLQFCGYLRKNLLWRKLQVGTPKCLSAFRNVSVWKVQFFGYLTFFGFKMLLYLLLKILEEIYKFTGENFAETYQ